MRPCERLWIGRKKSIYVENPARGYGKIGILSCNTGESRRSPESCEQYLKEQSVIYFLKKQEE